MLIVEKLNKKYPSFEVKDISFRLPKGYIMGFIGMNGSGKTTTLKSMLNIIKPDSGSVTVLGKNMFEYEFELKQDIGFMFGAFDYYPKTKIKKVMDIYKRFFTYWDEKQYYNLLKRFNVDENKKVGELSAGMKVKLGLAAALSHNAKLLILDEPTSGLDPVARDELLELFREIINEGEKSILFSTHITSDLDKCADYIIFIRNGELVGNDTKDDIIAKHALVKGSLNTLTENLKSQLINYKINSFGFSGLVLRKNLKANDSLKIEVPNLEDLMVYYNRETEATL